MAQANPRDLSVERQLPHKEVRFAVVMYGGVSLAIYIHGVAHELLSLVRATARNKKSGEYVIPDQELKGAELVYRSLGETLKAKFIVDILSGTSAGGINAVYLAKALVGRGANSASRREEGPGATTLQPGRFLANAGRRIDDAGP